MGKLKSDSKNHVSKVEKNMQELKEFFSLVYDGELSKNEYIDTSLINKGIAKNTFFSSESIDMFIDQCFQKSTYSRDTYFRLPTTDGNGSKEENLIARTCIFLDFDEKENGEHYSIDDIIKLFKGARLHYHILVNSGHGIHAYILIEKTKDLKMVQEVQKSLQALFNSCKGATKVTQLARVPFTYNVKNKDKKERVRLIRMDNPTDEKFRRYKIEELYKWFCTEAKKVKPEIDSKNTSINKEIPYCIKYMLENGSAPDGRYVHLCNIVVTLRRMNKSLDEIYELCDSWNKKSNYKLYTRNMVKNIFETKQKLNYGCSECNHKAECMSNLVSDFEYDENETLVPLDETNMSRLKKNRKKGSKVMEANDLLVYGVLKVHSDGLYKEEILLELSYAQEGEESAKPVIQEKVLSKALKNLEENGFVNVRVESDKRKFYTLNEGKPKAELQYYVSFSVIDQCIKRRITPEQLKLYNYMRYLHHKEQRENPTTLKGNLFQVNQDKLADDLGVTQARISQMIKNLLNEHILGIWYRQKSKNNNYEYNIYRLKY